MVGEIRISAKKPKFWNKTLNELPMNANEIHEIWTLTKKSPYVVTYQE